jgi:hypothetical protein
MNSNPIFTDSRGNPIRRKRRKHSEPLRQWQKFVLSLLIVVVAPLTLEAAVTQLDLVTQVKNLLSGTNGGLNANASAFTGVLREASGTASASELSGDATTSASNAVTVVKVNGTTVPTNSAADQVLDTTASATGAWKTLGDTSAGGLAETYNATTHAFGTIAIISGTFSDNEVPSGTINGANLTFTLAHTPNPAASLTCFKNNGFTIAGGSDYTLATATLTFASTTSTPQTGDTLKCTYRY